MHIDTRSLFLGGLLGVLAATGVAFALFAWPRELAAPPADAGEARREPSGGPGQHPPTEPEPRAPVTEAPAREPVGHEPLQPDALRGLLAAARTRLDQVAAITALLANGSAEARQVLLDAFLASDDKVLLTLLEEALLRSTHEMTPSLMLAFGGMRAPAKLDRLANMLRQAAMNRPELTDQVVAFLIGALDQPGDPHEEPAAGALRAFGRGALEQLVAHLRERGCGAEAAGSVAEILSKLPPECSEVLRDKVAQGFDATRELLGDPTVEAADKELARRKTGSLAWAAFSRPASEHDALAQVLADQLGRSADAGQVGTLAWGIGNLSGLSDAGRKKVASALLGSLQQQSDRNIRGTIAASLVQLAIAGGPGSYEAIRGMVESARIAATDATVLKQLERMLADLEVEHR